MVWADELRRRIAARTTELGQVAVHDPPGHLLRILGLGGAVLSKQQWANVAGRLEGYRERWGIKQMGKPPPRHGAQAAHWRQGYEDLVANATPVDLGDGLVVHICSLDDLIRMKRAAGRPKDRIELEILAAVRDESDREHG